MIEEKNKKKIKKKLFDLFLSVGNQKIESKEEMDVIACIQSSSAGNLTNMIIGVKTKKKKIILMEITLNDIVGITIMENKKEFRPEFVKLLSYVYRFSSEIEEYIV